MAGVQAGGHPADHARLGILEQQLEEMTGRPGIIDQVAAQVVPRGTVKGTARRSMSMPAALRAIVLMALMPDAGYGEILAALFGDLPPVPWHKPFAVPSPGVLATWRKAAGPEPLAGLQDRVLAAAGAEHRACDDRLIEAGGLQVCAVDGSLTRMPDTAANRAASGEAGAAPGGSVPYPQLRQLFVTVAATRGALAVLAGPASGDKSEAGQALLDRALAGHPEVFAKDRLFVMDRNFPGIVRIRKLTAVTHVLIRLRSDIKITKTGGFLPDGSYMADIGGSKKNGTIGMRVIEYLADVDGQDTGELFCLVTDLDDWETHPAGMLAAVYGWRWDGSETALREAKSAIRGAGPSTGPVFRSCSPDLIRHEHAAWITAAELTRAAARQAAHDARPARTGRRAGQPVQPREISFTAARRAAITSTRAGTATASLPAPLRAAHRARIIAGLGKHRVVLDRDRHRPHQTKARHRPHQTKARHQFPAAGRDITTRTAPATITICAPIAA